MKIFQRPTYLLIFGNSPCDVFTYFNISHLHGLNAQDCKSYNNTDTDAYIWGLANYIPKGTNIYKTGDARFIFINLQRCKKDFRTYGGIFHELMHHSLDIHKHNMELEEEIISWAEEESHEVYGLLEDCLEKII